MSTTFDVVSDWAELSALSAEWAELLARSDGNEPTMTPSWVEAWWGAFGGRDGRELRAVTVRHGGRLVGLAPFVRRVHRIAPGIPVRRLDLMPSGESEVDEICSDYIGVLAERGRQSDVHRAVCDALSTGALGTWDEAVFPAMDGEKAGPWALSEELRRRGYATLCEQTSVAPYVPLPGSWDEYLASLSSSRRYFINRSLRDFNDWAKGGITFEQVRTAEDLERGLRVLVSLHEKRWSADGGGVFRSPAFMAFHRRVMRALLASGGLDLGFLLVDGEAVAAGYNIIHERKLYFYQSGRRPELPSKIRAGVVWHALAIQRAIERGLREYDFLAGASRYKLQFAERTRPVVRVRVVRPVWLEAVAALSDCMRRTLRPAPPRPAEAPDLRTPAAAG